MGPEISAAALLRPLDTPRPAEPASRTPAESDGFKNYLNDARTPSEHRKSQSAQRGESARDRKPVERNKTKDESPDTSAAQAEPQPAPQSQPPVDQQVQSIESPPPQVPEPTVQANSAVSSSTILSHNGLVSIPVAVTSTNTNTNTIQNTNTIDNAHGDVAKDTANESSPRPTAPTPLVEPPSVNGLGLGDASPAVVPLPKVTPSVAPNPDDVVTDPESPDRPLICKKAGETRPVGSNPNEAVIPAQKWTTDGKNAEAQSEPSPTPAAHPVSAANGKVEPAAGVKEVKDPGPIAIDTLRPNEEIQVDRSSKRELGRGRFRIDRSESSLKDVDPATVAPKHQRVAIRGGSGDSSAAAVGRFLIETSGGDHPTTANVPSHAGDRPPDLSSANPSPIRPAADLSKNVDVTATTLSRLLVSGGESQDPIGAAAKILSSSQREGNHRVTLQLDPPALGQIRLDIRMEQNDMTLRVAADSAAVGKMIESRLSDLRDALATHGIRIDRSDVVVRSHGSEGANAPFSHHGGSTNLAEDRRHADSAPFAWSEDRHWGAGREDQAGADRPPSGRSNFADEEAPAAAISWEPVTAGGGFERTWVDLVA